MPRYRNGFIPDSELVLIERNHPATRGTAARWEALKADVLAHEGVTLRITGGENAYRSFSGQVYARQQACARGRCNDAALPGTSSHGGSLNGRDSGAIDVANWADIGIVKFYAYCWRNGFEPGHFDWEPWHIIDWAPYTIPATGGGSAPITPPTPAPSKERSDMEFISITVPEEVAKGGISGNNDAGCAILNTSEPNHAYNPQYIRVTDPNYQETANGYARSFGRNANEVKRQDWANLVEANRLSHLNRK